MPSPTPTPLVAPRLQAAGSRPLIFSQWTALLDIMEWLMDELRLPYVRLDGSTAVDERLATVDRCVAEWQPPGRWSSALARRLPFPAWQELVARVPSCLLV